MISGTEEDMERYAGVSSALRPQTARSMLSFQLRDVTRQTA